MTFLKKKTIVIAIELESPDNNIYNYYYYLLLFICNRIDYSLSK